MGVGFDGRVSSQGLKLEFRLESGSYHRMLDLSTAIVISAISFY